MPKKVNFLLEGATIHTTESLIEYFQAMEIEIFPLPTRIPDFNLLKMFKNSFQIIINNTVNDLKKAILSVWNKFIEDYLTKLISSKKITLFKS